MVLAVHDVDHRAHRGPQGSELVDHALVGAGERRQDAPAAVEQLGEARLGARVLGAGDRMAGNEMHASGHEPLAIADHGALDRADIGQDGARLEVRSDLLGDRTIGANRGAHDHQVRAAHGLGGRGEGLADQSEAQRGRPRRLAARVADDLARQSAAAHGMADRGADEADADQRDAFEQWLAHAGLRPRNSARAATTARLSASVPIVMRKACGSP